MNALKSDSEIQDNFTLEIKNRLNTLSDLVFLFQDGNNQWKFWEDPIRRVAETTIPKKKNY